MIYVHHGKFEKYIKDKEKSLIVPLLEIMSINTLSLNSAFSSKQFSYTLSPSIHRFITYDFDQAQSKIN
jgi:hypothetical protein